MDRPARKTKTVNYCEAKDFDDDEDFASVKAPPSKKAREDVRQEQKKSSSKSSSQETNCQPTQSEKSRKPLDVKLYERDLEAAITLSSLNGTDELKEQSPTTREAKVIIPIDENTDPASLHLSNCSVDVRVMGLDQIISEKGSLASARQKSASKAAEVQRNKNDDDDDEDYQPKPAPDSESDEDFSEPSDSEDEEFTLKKPSKAIKKEKIAKKDQTKPTSASKKERPSSKASKSKSQTAASTPVRSPPTTKVAPKMPSSSCSVPTSKSAACLSPPGGRKPKWTPPAQIGKSSTPSPSSAEKSPGAGLRLGLSRLVRVKPLHPSVTSH
ncbi:RAD51-associated protein 1 isoform 2-T2 [Menidia menidia]